MSIIPALFKDLLFLILDNYLFQSTLLLAQRAQAWNNHNDRNRICIGYTSSSVSQLNIILDEQTRLMLYLIMVFPLRPNNDLKEMNTCPELGNLTNMALSAFLPYEGL